MRTMAHHDDSINEMTLKKLKHEVVSFQVARPQFASRSRVYAAAIRRCHA